MASHDSVIKVMIIYDDFSSAADASAALRCAAYHSHADIQLNINPCRVDVLKLPAAGDEALMQATGAHLIVFAGGFARCLTSWLQSWLERWAMCRQVRDAALAIIDNQNDRLPPVMNAPELFLFAKRHGLNLVFTYSILNQSGTKLFMNHLKEHGLPLLPARQHPMDLIINDACPSWSLIE